MDSYAAIQITPDTLLATLATVAEVPDGRSRLAWALFTYPYQKGIDYYFIGGNYLGLNQPNYHKQILSYADLSLKFEFNVEKIRNNGPKPDGRWFVVKPKEADKSVRRADAASEEGRRSVAYRAYPERKHGQRQNPDRSRLLCR